MDYSWTRISGRLIGENWEGEIEPVTVLGYEFSDECLHPWSAPHLEVCSRLGLSIRKHQGDVSGIDKVPIRVVIRRGVYFLSYRRYHVPKKEPHGNDCRCVPHQPTLEPKGHGAGTAPWPKQIR